MLASSCRLSRRDYPLRRPLNIARAATARGADSAKRREQITLALNPLEHLARSEDQRLRIRLGDSALELLPAHRRGDQRPRDAAQRVWRDRLACDVVLEPVDEDLARPGRTAHLRDDLVR